jgi:hypothetical protein
MPASIATRVEYINQSDMEKSTPGWDWINNAELLSKAAYGGWDGIDLSLIYGVLSIPSGKRHISTNTERPRNTSYSALRGMSKQLPIDKKQNVPQHRDAVLLHEGQSPYAQIRIRRNLIRQRQQKR